MPDRLPVASVFPALPEPLERVVLDARPAHAMYDILPGEARDPREAHGHRFRVEFAVALPHAPGEEQSVLLGARRFNVPVTVLRANTTSV